ncbi:MAG TPA: transcriptional regulator [Bacilli bacterium]|nr:transcriptional regulator [Bacilli bacterium]
MEIKEVVLNKMKEMGRPVTAGEVEQATGLDCKEVDKAFNALKKEGKITSPVRCKWQLAE